MTSLKQELSRLDHLDELRNRDIESAVAAIDNALQLHDRWLKRFLTQLVCREPISDDVIAENAHQRCQLGKWLLHDAPEALRQQEHFDEIEVTHKVMHDRAARLGLRQAGEDQPSRQDFAEFLNEQSALITKLGQLRDDLLSVYQLYDELTGTLRRRAGERVAEGIHAWTQRQQAPYSLAFLDLDHFKDINDKHGHLAGDRVLQHVAQLLIHSVRAFDQVIRYGGEEFMVILPDTTINESRPIIERLLHELAETAITVEQGIQITVTASAGLVQWTSGKQLVDLIGQADHAMYQAKQAGRNQLVIAS